MTPTDWPDDDVGSGFEKVVLTIGGQEWDLSQSTSVLFSELELTGGEYTAQLRAYDKAGNVSAPVSTSFGVYADLRIVSVTGTLASYSSGDKIDATVRVENTGLARADESYVNYYLGTNSNHRQYPIAWGYLGQENWFANNDMSPGEEDTDVIASFFSGGWTIPDYVVPGVYSVWVYAETESP